LLDVAGGEHSVARFNRRVRLTLAKWRDDLLAIHKLPGACWRERERERGSHARFTRAGDRPGTDTGPGLPEADFVVV